MILNAIAFSPLYTCHVYYSQHSEIPLIFVTGRDCRVYINPNYTREYVESRKYVQVRRDDDDDDGAERERDCVSTIEQKEVGTKTGIVLNANNRGKPAVNS